MPEVAVDLEIAGIDSGRGEIAHDTGRDRWRKEPVGPAQHVEDLCPDLAEVLDRVVADRGAPQYHQRVGVPPSRPIDRLLANLHLTRLAVRVARGERSLDAVALQ